MSDVRIALLGNSFASKIQLPALRRVGGNEVIGIAGADSKKARATAARWVALMLPGPSNARIRSQAGICFTIQAHI